MSGIRQKLIGVIADAEWPGKSDARRIR
jgi:hypothetical protein